MSYLRIQLTRRSFNCPKILLILMACPPSKKSTPISLTRFREGTPNNSLQPFLLPLRLRLLPFPPLLNVGYFLLPSYYYVALTIYLALQSPSSFSSSVFARLTCLTPRRSGSALLLLLRTDGRNGETNKTTLGNSGDFSRIKRR